MAVVDGDEDSTAGRSERLVRGMDPSNFKDRRSLCGVLEE